MRWLDKRANDRPKIHGVAAYQHDALTNGRLQPDIGPDSRELIVDLPAALPHDQLYEQTYDANSILIPVLPSAIDIYSASRFIAELLLIAQIDRRDRQIAIIANRTRRNTRSLQMLTRFLTSLRIPLIAQFRDSQNFVSAAAEGIGIFEMPAYRVRKDIEQMESVVNWLDQWRMRKLDAAASTRFEHRPGAEILTPLALKTSA